MITKESASKQVTSLHSTIRVQVRWGENWGWGQIFPHNAAAEIFYRNRTSGVVAVAADGAIMADKCSNFWPSQGCSVKICQNMLSEHSYRGLLLRSLSSRSDWTHGADRGHHILLLQSMQKLQIIQNILTIMCTISDFIWLSIVRSSWGAWVGNWSHFLVYNEDNLLVQIFLPVGKCQNYFPMKSH